MGRDQPLTQAVTTAIILAGGFGTRLRAAVSDVPKPLAPVGGRPFLALQLDWLERHGIESVCISAHYMADKILSYAAEARQTTGLAINVVVEDEPLGTGGAVCHAMNSSHLQKSWHRNSDSECTRQQHIYIYIGS